MKLSDFDFYLPEKCIARFPSDRRDESRLMKVNRKTGSITHHMFKDIVNLTDNKDFFVVNNSAVIPVKFFCKAGESDIEILVKKQLSGFVAEVFGLPGKKLKPGRSFDVSAEYSFTVESVRDDGSRIVKFNKPLTEVFAAGYAPLPPYIKRKKDEAEKYRDFDLRRYQTVFSKRGGSIAAPTAGLHFTGDIYDFLRKERNLQELTLNVGFATFQKIEKEDLSEHRMGREEIEISDKTAESILALRKDKSLVAVGTTSVRSLETWAQNDFIRGGFASEIFIYPGYSFRMVDKLITNFHLPKSSLFLLTSAFGGSELLREAYETAIKEDYRFFSYGDCMFIE